MDEGGVEAVSARIESALCICSAREGASPTGKGRSGGRKSEAWSASRAVVPLGPDGVIRDPVAGRSAGNASPRDGSRQLVRRFATVAFAGVTVVVAVALAGCGSASRAAAASATSPAGVASQALDVPAGYTASADQLAFTGPGKGWLALGLAPNGKLPERTAVLSTRDGGATWSQRWEGVGSPGQLVAAGPDHAFLTVDSEKCTISFGYCQARLLSLASGRGGPAHLVGQHALMRLRPWLGRGPVRVSNRWPPPGARTCGRPSLRTCRLAAPSCS